MIQIKYENVTKQYGDHKVVDNVSFEIEKGEFVFIVGPSGAGKSTLLKMLIKEINPEEGDVLFEGESILYLEYEQLPDLRRKIGVVFQDFKPLDSRNVYENVAISLEVIDSDENVIKDVVPNVLGLVGLGDKQDKFPSQLSGGELQRLSIARALAHEPDVLIADEPTGMIDPKSSSGVVDVLEKIHSLGTTVIMSTHDNTIVDKYKKRVIRLEEGKIISDKKEGKYHD